MRQALVPDRTVLEAWFCCPLVHDLRSLGHLNSDSRSVLGSAQLISPWYVRIAQEWWRALGPG